VLLKKLFNVGFVEIKVVERTAFGLDELGRYPLFAPDFLQFLRDAIPPVRHRELVFSIAVTASRPEAAAPAPSR
jgi:hypothetical protein